MIMRILIKLFSISFLLYVAAGLCVPRERQNTTFYASAPISSTRESLISISPSPSYAIVHDAPSPSPSNGINDASSSQPPSFAQASIVPEQNEAPSLLPKEIPIGASSLCQKADHPELCQSSIIPFLPPTGSVDIQRLVSMEIEATVSLCRQAIAQADKLMNTIGTTPATKSSIGICKDGYKDAIDNFESASRALTTLDMPTVKIMLSAAIADVSTCDDGFGELPGVRSPLAAVNDELSKLIDNSLALSSLL